MKRKYINQSQLRGDEMKITKEKLKELEEEFNSMVDEKTINQLIINDMAKKHKYSPEKLMLLAEKKNWNAFGDNEEEAEVETKDDEFNEADFYETEFREKISISANLLLDKCVEKLRKLDIRELTTDQALKAAQIGLNLISNATGSVRLVRAGAGLSLYSESKVLSSDENKKLLEKFTKLNDMFGK